MANDIRPVEGRDIDFIGSGDFVPAHAPHGTEGLVPLLPQNARDGQTPWNWKDPSEEVAGECQSPTKSGQQCQGRPLDNGFCFAHQKYAQE